MRHEETLIQMSVVSWVKSQYPDAIFTAVPSWGQGVIQGRKNKRMGLCKDWPDLFFAEPRGVWKGLFVEIKSESGRKGKGQEQMIEELNRRGYFACFAIGFNEAVRIITSYLGPIRG